MQLAMIQDDLIPFGNLDPSYTDRGIYFGDGVYEVIRSYNGKLFALEEHMQRFGQSLAAININFDLKIARDRVKRAFSEAKIPNAKIYWHVTRGSGPRDHFGGDELSPNFFLTIGELHDDETEVIKRVGICVSTFPDWRWKRCDIKSLNLLANILACRDAKIKNCQEAILYDENSYVTEGASSTFFIIVDGKIQTTPLSDNILPSITRIFVLSAASALGIEVITKRYTAQQAMQAQEMFIAQTTKDIVPVVKFDNQIISGGKPGPITFKLMTEIRKQIDECCARS